MYDKAPYTAGMRTVLRLSKSEAARLGHEEIHPEHYLLGILQRGEGLGIQTLVNLDIDLDNLQEEIERGMEPGGGPVAEPAGPNVEAKQVLDMARAASVELHHGWIGTEHLLLGLLRAKDQLPSILLRNKGIDFSTARGEVINVIEGGSKSLKKPVRRRPRSEPKPEARPQPASKSADEAWWKNPDTAALEAAGIIMSPAPKPTEPKAPPEAPPEPPRPETPAPRDGIWQEAPGLPRGPKARTDKPDSPPRPKAAPRKEIEKDVGIDLSSGLEAKPHDEVRQQTPAPAASDAAPPDEVAPPMESPVEVEPDEDAMDAVEAKSSPPPPPETPVPSEWESLDEDMEVSADRDEIDVGAETEMEFTPPPEPPAAKPLKPQTPAEDEVDLANLLMGEHGEPSPLEVPPRPKNALRAEAQAPPEPVGEEVEPIVEEPAAPSSREEAEEADLSPIPEPETEPVEPEVVKAREGLPVSEPTPEDEEPAPEAGEMEAQPEPVAAQPLPEIPPMPPAEPREAIEPPSAPTINVMQLLDGEGNRIAVGIPSEGREEAIAEFLEDLQGLEAIRARRNEPTIGKEELMRRLGDDGLL